MTSQVVVMNKRGLAMASDSAATQRYYEYLKAFPVATKIYAPSEKEPVGIMTHRNSEFMDIPWEIIVGRYRSQSKTTGFKTLPEYAADLLRFLQSEPQFTDATRELNLFERTMYFYFIQIHNSMQERLQKDLRERDQSTRNEHSVISTVIQEYESNLQSCKLLENLPEGFRGDLLTKYRYTIEGCAGSLFQDLNLSENHVNELADMAVEVFTRDPPGSKHMAASGVVICGYGNDDLFPALIVLRVGGIMNGCLWAGVETVAQVTYEENALIMPFAVGDEIKAFFSGSDPEYDIFVRGLFSSVLESGMRKVVELNTEWSEDRKARALEEVSYLRDEQLGVLMQQLQNYRHEKVTAEILHVVRVLPKEQLALLAESLVNLETFKQRISMKTEMVGGPVDVATISKEEGFVWIRKKGSLIEA